MYQNIYFLGLNRLKTFRWQQVQLKPLNVITVYFFSFVKRISKPWPHGGQYFWQPPLFTCLTVSSLSSWDNQKFNLGTTSERKLNFFDIVMMICSLIDTVHKVQFLTELISNKSTLLPTFCLNFFVSIKCSLFYRLRLLLT